MPSAQQDNTSANTISQVSPDEFLRYAQMSQQADEYFEHNDFATLCYQCIEAPFKEQSDFLDVVKEKIADRHLWNYIQSSLSGFASECEVATPAGKPMLIKLITLPVIFTCQKSEQDLEFDLPGDLVDKISKRFTEFDLVENGNAYVLPFAINQNTANITPKAQWGIITDFVNALAKPTKEGKIMLASALAPSTTTMKCAVPNNDPKYHEYLNLRFIPVITVSELNSGESSDVEWDGFKSALESDMRNVFPFAQVILPEIYSDTIQNAVFAYFRCALNVRVDELRGMNQGFKVDFSVVQEPDVLQVSVITADGKEHFKERIPSLPQYDLTESHVDDCLEMLGQSVRVSMNGTDLN